MHCIYMSTISWVHRSTRNGRMCMNGKLGRMWKQSHPKLSYYVDVSERDENHKRLL
jgi:hypothetical protein